MNWNTLYDMQKQLDQYIEEQHKLQPAQHTDQKTLALLVELGELANETRCFKFWSLKGPSERDVILEEYVDGLHFLLSLGLDLGFEYQPKPVSAFHDQTEAFLEMYAKVEAFRLQKGNESYQDMFAAFLRVGETLGMTEPEIMDAYYVKNEKNYKRQEEGY
ncbi:dUTP diphosphatase [Halobacillus litoralis]|uniref:dUTP diphosphatase n=1 Tax=Halobacillus litoralis TaxID=45668 RepID=UPI001CD34ECB|nr:dUTP diphosphatase [Halobacillus litoralis]MCA0969862.1 dUTP diphosphatase [Halobacillus litoralis]